MSEQSLGLTEENTPEVSRRVVRQVYLVTYSQADVSLFPTRRAFAEAVCGSFTSSHEGNYIVQWSCCREQHRCGGLHYHMAIKLNRTQRWLPSKHFLLQRHGISVHFSTIHHNYYSAWKYITKEDEHVIQSAGHPDLWNARPPRTSQATLASQDIRRERQNNRTLEMPDSSSSNASGDPVCDDDDDDDDDDVVAAETVQVQRNSCSPAKKRRLTAFQLSEIIIEKGIKSRMELLALANQQKKEGKTDIAEFIVNRGPKIVAEVLNTAWEMSTAECDLERSRKTRLELLEESSLG